MSIASTPSAVAACLAAVDFPAPDAPTLHLAEAQEAWVGRRLEVLVERVEADGAEGRSFREAPDSDGVVRVEGAPRSTRVGEYLPVVVTAAQGPELLARPAG